MSEKVKIEKTNLQPSTGKRTLSLELNVDHDAYNYLTNISLESRITVPEIVGCIINNLGPGKIELEFHK